MSADSAIQLAIDRVPAGRWALAVSGGADSVALLRLLRQRSDLALHVVHLNHQLRGDESDGDAQFVATLADRFQLPATIVARSDVALDQPYNNLSEHLRRTRLKLFGDVAARQDLQGVLVAHHQDDQIETVLHRLLRGSYYRGLCGMMPIKRVAGVTMCRPLLNVPAAALRAHLESIGQPWREDSSNGGDAQARNLLRHFLARRAELREPLLRLMHAMRELRATVDALAANWPAQMDLVRQILQPMILRQQSARQWLHAAGVPRARVDSQLVERFLLMVNDAASPARLDVPGPITLIRRRGRLTRSGNAEQQ